MRKILLSASVVMLASCTTPDMATNAARPAFPQAAGTTANDEEPPVPAQLRRPPRQVPNGWGGNAYGGVY